jgi:hypothetical protein
MAQQQKLKNDMVGNALQAVLCSKVCHLILLTALCVALCLILKTLLVLAFPIAFGGLYGKPIVFEAILIGHVVERSMGSFQWYSLVDSDLYLGAVPLDHADLDTLVREVGIKAVMSIVQGFEVKTATAVGRPVTPEQWREAGVTQLLVESADFYPPSFEAMDKAAAFLNVHLSEGRKTYVHCKVRYA